MKINLISFSQNRILKPQEKAQKPTHVVPNKSDFSLAQNIISNYSRAMISFGARKVNEAALREYIAQNPAASQKEIAEYFKVSVSTICNLIHKYNIEYSGKYPKSPINKEVLSEYILNHPNENQKQIAEHFGVTKIYIGQLIERFDIPYRNKRKINVTPKQIQSYIEAHKDASLDKIAEHFGISASSVSSIIIENNIEYHKKYKQATISAQEVEDYILNNPNASQAKIAKHFGLSQAYIDKIITKYNLPYVSKKAKPI